MRQLMSVLRRFISPSETLEGYEQSELVDVIFRKTVAYEPTGDWPEMAGVSSVLDFGGGCGLHYKQARSNDVRWAVVETPAMVERAKELATDRLQFFTSISDAADWLGSIDVMYSNGALQYTADPSATLKRLCAIRATKMLWQRVLLSDLEETEREVQSSLLGDNGPGTLRIREKTVRYVCTKLPALEFIAAHGEYSLEERGSDWFLFQIALRM